MRKSYALFDFDGTLIGGDSIILFMRYALRRKLCSAADLMRFVAAGGLFTFKLVSPKAAKEIGLRFLKGRERAEFAATAEDFCRTELVPRLYPQGVEAVKRHRDAGDEVLLVSASPTFYLEPLKAMLDLNEVIGTQFEVDGSGRFTGRIVGQNCRGDGKILRLEEYMAETGAELDYEASSAYGNSSHDFPMLKLCRHAYAVNPSRHLQKKLEALDGVTVLNWKEKP